MDAFLLALTVVANVIANGFLRNTYSKKDIGNMTDFHVFNTVSNLSSALVLALIAFCAGQMQSLSTATVLYGILLGVIAAVCSFVDMAALAVGPLSYTGIFQSCSMVIPAFSGLLFFEESVSVYQYAGAVMMILSFVCAVDTKADKNKASFRWVVYCFISFIFNGSIGVVQKFHQNTPAKEEIFPFLVITFAVSTLLTAFLWPACARKTPPTALASKGKVKKLVFYSASVGALIAFCNYLSTYLSGVMPSIIVFPVINGGIMLLTSATGLFLFREKLTKKQFLGLCAGMAAILLLCIQSEFIK